MIQLVIVMFSHAFPYLRPSASRPDLMVIQSSPTLIKQSEIRTFRQELGLIPSVFGPLGLLDGLLMVTPCIVTLSQKAGLTVQKGELMRRTPESCTSLLLEMCTRRGRNSSIFVHFGITVRRNQKDFQ